ncbi:thiol reductant ABC exporter subunit CydC [Paenibacillus apiarius]|uniref:Thiol reductant ABC exporter subunit CydC n=1 Tax=Paenibacillus apiarius TaxID=46240 RepID=A0ABT4DQ65_9BACL|nr:thiol reductant ABC exporter subunit CydC [Paenibacillus apiarius]MBN3524160.1 thiol reductant ABC exporter subunit CydC [Paenibacillus apiarius]MCY9513947.1 thiol reductant ABC exporter subunit CydC [Paenibacillus apiarius]MCY9519464.1 thiol reductant ABC exporter subunit CydC [Paenibacillus apiarius]MCY9552391.1 thiol reductant ABC exporter subunit CydC [Paenibacillus apiarius]MCY9556219.1 thiol reductant ABC exporter subunit CydC [Paenibacillus apiarius]
MKREAWFRPYLRTYFWRFAIIVALGMLTVLCASSLMFTSGYLISKSALRPENILMVYVPIVLVRTFGIGRAAVHYIERLVGHDAVLRILSSMRVRLYRMLEPQALFIRSRFRTGDILGVLADDIEYLQNVYLRTVFPTIVAVVMYVACIAALGWFDVPFALLMALYLLILIFVLPWLSLLITRTKQKQVKQDRNRLYQKLTDAVLGMSDWVISGRSPQFVASYETDEAAVARVDGTLRGWSRWRMFIGQCVAGLAVVSMLYWSGQQAADGHISVTLIAAFTLVVFPLMEAFLPVSEAIEKIPQYQDSLERLAKIQDSPGETAGTAERHVPAEALPAAETNARITMDKVRYRYDAADAWIIDGISIDIPQGKKIALIGRSGAGKSTILKLIQGAVAPDQGSVAINGVDASAYGEAIPRVISVLNQSPHLFDTTVANNIRLGARDASDEDIRRVAKQVRLDALIDSLPAGYDTPMLETGQRFSGGERQRIALARILLQDTPVVILDEPTVGLDPRTERELLATMFETIQGKSLVWITHHLVGVEQMDEVIFIENGQVEMRGSHAELMEHVPRYRKLYHLDRPDTGFM